ncbi:MAG: hypothetical protein JXQ73_27960 [Phycisphaerae bacterium]|nr:hypothetical protein [Phycisphaerae bacterium]
MSVPSESVIICEGYYDRAFWTGWLARLGCKDPGGPVRDPWGKDVVGRGQRAFYSPSGSFIRLLPAGGDRTKIIRAARLRLNQASTNSIRCLVINVDTDEEQGIDLEEGTKPTVDAVRRLVRGFEEKPMEIAGNGFSLWQESTYVFALPWVCGDEPCDELPAKQTLERLACAALREVYPDRSLAVHAWLTSRPGPTDLHPKAFSWSHMAGWYFDDGCEFFFEHLWRDKSVATALEARLEASGAWQVGERLVNRSSSCSISIRVSSGEGAVCPHRAVTTIRTA